MGSNLGDTTFGYWRTMRRVITLGLAALVLSGCGAGGNGDSKSQPESQAAASGGTCKDVLLSESADQTIYASEIEATDIACTTAEEIAKQWGRQNTGGPDAELPAGWTCGAGGDCSNGSARVTFSLKYE
jgi:hypothetical protein